LAGRRSSISNGGTQSGAQIEGPIGIIGGVLTMTARIVYVIPDVPRPMHSETLACVPAGTSVA
jgi:hypothetical protein